MNRRSLTLIAGFSFIAALSGCKSESSMHVQTFGPHDRIYLAVAGEEFNGSAQHQQSIFFLGAGDALGAAVYTRYVAGVMREYDSFRYVTVPGDDRPE